MASRVSDTTPPVRFTPAPRLAPARADAPPAAAKDKFAAVLKGAEDRDGAKRGSQTGAANGQLQAEADGAIDQSGKMSALSAFGDDDQDSSGDTAGDGSEGAALVHVATPSVIDLPIVTPVAASSAPLLSDAQVANIDRMAALIAEASANGAQSVFTVDFGVDNLIAKSAVIGFDASGALSLTLVETNPALAPHALSALRSALTERLDRRRITIGRIDMGDEPRDVSDEEPALGRRV